MAKIYRRQRKKSSYVSKGTGRANQIRTRQAPKQLTEKQKLFRATKVQVDRANKRLRNLEKSGFINTWASGKLESRLSKGKLKGKKLIKRNRIKISKDLSATNLLNINKATRQFLESKTSTTRGIEETRKSVIESLQSHYGSVGQEISYKQAETLYNLFDETDFEDIARYSSASTVWTNVNDYLTGEINEKTLIDRLVRYSNVDYNNDADMREKVDYMLEYLNRNK